MGSKLLYSSRAIYILQDNATPDSMEQAHPKHPKPETHNFRISAWSSIWRQKTGDPHWTRTVPGRIVLKHPSEGAPGSSNHHVYVYDRP